MATEVGCLQKPEMNWLIHYAVLPISAAWGTTKPTLVRVSDKTTLEDPAPGLGQPFNWYTLAETYVPQFKYRGYESWSCQLWFVELDSAYPILSAIYPTQKIGRAHV